MSHRSKKTSKCLFGVEHGRGSVCFLLASPFGSSHRQFRTFDSTLLNSSGRSQRSQRSPDDLRLLFAASPSSGPKGCGPVRGVKEGTPRRFEVENTSSTSFRSRCDFLSLTAGWMSSFRMGRSMLPTANSSKGVSSDNEGLRSIWTPEHGNAQKE